MVRAPTLEHVVARVPTFRAVSIQKVAVGKWPRPIILPGLGGRIDPLY